jgi:tetrapyrrole methylase family protein/MazG family protein
MTIEVNSSLECFLTILKKLRDPENGCPWDREQTHQTLKKFLIEESYEVLDAIDNSTEQLCEELGDLLLQIGLHAQIASENGSFSMSDILLRINKKLFDRHPHVFGTRTANDSSEVVALWEEVKASEKDGSKGILQSIPRHLPALSRAQKISKRAAKCGFEWETIGGIRDKILEEVAEFATEAARPIVDETALKNEFGDILFSLIQLARRFGFDAEEALQTTNQRFIDRFERMEQVTTKDLKDLSVDEWRILWDEAKQFVNHLDSTKKDSRPIVG